MGPGLNSFVESELLRDVWPKPCEYWNQPPVCGPNAYRDLVNATLLKLEALSENGKRKVDLIAHSFGGHLARECVTKNGHLVGSVKMISAGHDPIAGFHRLLGRLAQDSETPESVRENARAFLTRHALPAKALLWEMVGIIVQDSRFMRLYWPSSDYYNAYEEMTARAPALNFQTFQDVLNDFSRNGPPIPSRISWKGKCELILGEKDPLLNPTEVRRFWEICFPDLQVTLKPQSGHFPHLENALRPTHADDDPIH